MQLLAYYNNINVCLKILSTPGTQTLALPKSHKNKMISFKSFHANPVFSRETVNAVCLSQSTHVCNIYQNNEQSLIGKPFRIIGSNSTVFLSMLWALSTQSMLKKAVESV